MHTTTKDLNLGLTDLNENSGWIDQALCAQTDPEAFFPDKGGSTRQAKAICGSCPVRQSCLDHALTHPQTVGIWGGLSEHERRKVKKTTIAQSAQAQNGTAA